MTLAEGPVAGGGTGAGWKAAAEAWLVSIEKLAMATLLQQEHWSELAGENHKSYIYPVLLDALMAHSVKEAQAMRQRALRAGPSVLLSLAAAPFNLSAHFYRGMNIPAFCKHPCNAAVVAS